jgi:hypothetical protein
MQWLSDKRHDQLKEEIKSNHLLGLGIKSLLNQNHKSIMIKLDTLNQSLLSISSTMEGMNEIANAVTPNSGLSNQAVSIIKQLVESGENGFRESIATYDGKQYKMLNNSEEIAIEDYQFIDDDLNQLVADKLLLLDHNSQGGRCFKITRLAAKVVKQMA